jgi:hypothetical protein
MPTGAGVRLPDFPDATGFTDADLVFMTQNGATVKGTVAQLKTAVAISATAEAFVPGDGVTAGTFLPGGMSITLTGNYASINDLDVYADAVPQLDCTLTGQVLGFSPTIPTGISKIIVRGKQARSIGSPSDATVTDAKLAPGSNIYFVVKRTADPRAYGAAGDGVTDDMPALLRAIAANPEVEFTAGTYALNPGTLPSTLRLLTARPGVTIVPGPSVPTGAGFSTWLTAAGLTNAEISGLQFQAPSVTYGGLTVLLGASCVSTKITDLVLQGAGYNGISLALGSRNKVLGCDVIDYKGGGIIASGSSLAVLDIGTEIAGCYTQGNGASSIAHGVAFNFCQDFNGHDNRSISAGTFGFSANQCEGGILHNNISSESIHEGLNVEDSNFIKVIGNRALWAVGGGSSFDYGMSFFANSRNCFGLEVLDNSVVNSGSCGIAYAGSSTFGVQHSPLRGNLVFNCNQKKAATASGTDNLAGIMLSATQTQANPVAGNTVVDVGINALTYGIAELDFGTGAPTSNEITSNRTFAQNNFSGGSAIHTAGPSTKTALNTSQL